MKLKFKTMKSKQKIDDVPSYIKNYIKKYSDKNIMIYIGCDSQVHRSKVYYATAIVLHRVGYGAHVIYSKDYEKRKNRQDDPGNIFMRLWGEVERTLKVAKYLSENGIHADRFQVDFDLNTDKKYDSNRVVASAMGYASSEGFKSNPKPDAFSATYAAGKIVSK